MKKLIFLAVLTIGSCGTHWHNQVQAGMLGNFNLFGGNHHHHRNGGRTEPVSVPEPATILLIGGGLVALAAYRKLRGQK